MASVFVFIGLLSFALISTSTEGRKDPGEYWRSVMHDEAMPEAIQGLMHVDSSVHHLSKDKKADCDMKNSDDSVKDFEPRPNVSVYHDDAKLKVDDKSFNKDFEPRPSTTAYNDDVGLKQEKPFVEDIEPRPNISVYQD